jgi:hypothetical protein
MRKFLIITGLIALTGCSDATAPAPAPVVHLSVRTDQSVYSMARDSAAWGVLMNLGPDPVYAPMNEFVFVEQWSNGQWVDRHPWFAVDGVGISFRLSSGDSLTTFMPMPFGYVGNRPGTYRFAFEVAYDSLGRRLVPESLSASPPFELQP